MIARPQFRRRRTAVLGTAALATICVAAMLGWHNGGAAGASAAPAAAAAWELPYPRASDAEQAAEILRQRKPWGGQAAFNGSETPAVAPAAAIPWRLVGTVERGTERYALISVSGQPGERLEYRTIGEAMPDGGSLLKIDADSVTVRAPGAGPDGTVYRLFDKKQ